MAQGAEDMPLREPADGSARAREFVMNEADSTPRPDPAPAPAGLAIAAPSSSGSDRAGRIVLVLAALLALTAGGVAAYRGQRDAAAIALPPAPSESQVPSVDDVITRLEARLKAKPDDAEGWRMLGWSYFQTQHYAEAATALKQAVKLDAEHAETYSFLGESLVLASKTEGKIPRDAKAAFDMALKLDPKDARARYFRAVAMDLAGQHRKAIDTWFALLKDTPSDAPYADDIRAVIKNVGTRYKIPYEERLAAAQFAAPAGGMATNGAAVAAGGIPGPSTAEIKAASTLPKGQQEAMIRGMVDGLEAKLGKNPDNVDGWIMLLRSRMQLGEPGKAARSLQDGLAAFRNDQAAARKLREAASAIQVPGAGSGLRAN
jgi:cytochrome c-type biogenesis protein CcmH